jgi:hypothetical protein
VLCAGYWCTRPPELVWWTSPPIGKGRHTVKMLFPAGWSATLDSTYDDVGAKVCMRPQKTPAWLTWLTKSYVDEDAIAYIWVSQCGSTRLTPKALPAQGPLRKHIIMSGGVIGFGSRLSADRQEEVVVLYARHDERAFNRTYKQICNSLRIE